MNAAGYCVAHDPEKPMDLRELGKRSGEARRRPNPERVHPNLREYLRREVPPERVWRALELAMEGQNESARVSASKVLMDALADRHEEAEQRDHAAETAAASAELFRLLEKYIEAIVRQESSGAAGFVDSQGVVHDRGGDSQVMAMIRRAVRRAREGHEKDLEAVIGEMVGKIIDSIAGGLVPGDVSAERAARTLKTLEETGLLVPRARVEALGEEIAQERLQALRQEHPVA